MTDKKKKKRVNNMKNYKEAEINEKFVWTIFDSKHGSVQLEGVRLEKKHKYKPSKDKHWTRREKCSINYEGKDRDCTMVLGLFMTPDGSIVELPLILEGLFP